MHNHEWKTTQADDKGRVLEQTCGCGCGEMSWYDPDGATEADRGRRCGPRPLVITGAVLAVKPYDSWVGHVDALEIAVALG